MFLLCGTRTMANAKRIIVEEPPKPKREKLVDLSRRWQAKQAAKARAANPVCRPMTDIDPLTHLDGPQYRSMRDMIETVCAWHPGVSYADVIGSSRKRPIIAARFDAIAAIWINCKVGGERPSLPVIGKAVGGKDHTSVMSALRRRGL